MPTSFRQEQPPIPPRYQTPSPPRDAFEPLSPITNPEGTTIESLGLQWTHNTRHRNGPKRPYSTSSEEINGPIEQARVRGGAMDAFASIALATKSDRSHQSTTSSTSSEPLNGYTNERPAKRARSEKLPSPEWSRKRVGADDRPATSYEQSPEDRRLEAELLLNFAQAAAKLTSSSPVLHHISLTHSQATCETTGYGQPESNIHAQADEDQQPVSHEARTTDETARKPGVKALHQISAKTDDKPPSRENSSGSQTVIPTPTKIEVADIPPDTSEGCHTTSRAVTPEILEEDDVDLILDNSRAEQVIIAEHVQIADDVKAPPDFKSSGPDSGSENDVGSGEKITSLNEVQAPANVINDAVRVEEGDANMEEVPVEQANPRQVQQPVQEEVANESRHVPGTSEARRYARNESLSTGLEDAASLKSDDIVIPLSNSNAGTPDIQSQPTTATAVCAACKFIRNSKGVEMELNSTSWISCDACKSWFHFACAGFKNEREVRSVDKYRCRQCKPVHGSTTYVRKSSRAHSAIDYAGLHQGVIKTSDERPEHHYIKPIKEGTITFLLENFARMRPELVTAEYFAKGSGMKEPIVIPACFNPRPQGTADPSTNGKCQEEVSRCSPIDDNGISEDWFSRHPESESVPDHGQDGLDMVIPQGLTVRQVAELYGPDEKVEVIDVKSQNGENKKWNMRRWAEYYENPNNKVVRNVISLEVSQSKLGRLIRRPQIVRDLDLQDSVWPADLLAKGEYPRVQFYTLMSVADCFTDFHIDFGGSSVFYHILKGRKTFLFIPPKEKHLKKYEEWCMSPAQNWTFLGDQTKECYRVDLSEGDTMLIPSGWIHAVWTPEDSLVIGGNFLTRMNYGMQLRIAQVEKATGVARKFRYPHFQKLHWYTALRYLEDDPLPDKVRDMLHAGGSFHRERAAYYEFDYWGENSRLGPENYHARYYSQSELDGLPDLTRYLLRTALIDIGNITDGISADTRNAVKKSIPRGHGEPLDVMKTFAAWCAWKRGNEPIPHWAYPDAVPENLSPDKLSAAATRKLDREAALLAPRRQSARMQSQQEAPPMASSEIQMSASLSDFVAQDETKRSSSDLSMQGQSASTPKRPRNALGTGTNSHRKTACESCRKRRRACKHKDEVASMAASTAMLMESAPTCSQTMAHDLTSPLVAREDGLDHTTNVSESPNAHLASSDAVRVHIRDQTAGWPSHPHTSLQSQETMALQPNTVTQEGRSEVPMIDLRMSGDAITSLDDGPGSTPQARPRHKACNECRKSKRRCIHDAFGNEDPIKVRETAIPRPHARKSNIQGKLDLPKRTSGFKQSGALQTNIGHLGPIPDPPMFHPQVSRMAPVANMVAEPSNLGSQMGSIASLQDAEEQRKIAESASLLLDPALFLDDANSFHQEEKIINQFINPLSVRQGEELPQNAETQLPELNEHHSHNNPLYIMPDVRPDPEPSGPRESFKQPASSLVSPPASSHGDAGNSPTIANADWGPSRSSSEQSAEQPKQLQRYTPESGSMRRASSSSYSENVQEKVATPTLKEHPSSQEPRLTLNPNYLADEESLQLIKELQAQDLGLRRRGKA